MHCLACTVSPIPVVKHQSLTIDNDFSNPTLTSLTQTSVTAVVQQVIILDPIGTPVLLFNDFCMCRFLMSCPSSRSISVHPVLELERESHDRVNILANMADQSYKGLGSSIVSWDWKVYCTDEATVSGLAGRENHNMWKFSPCLYLKYYMDLEKHNLTYINYSK